MIFRLLGCSITFLTNDLGFSSSGSTSVIILNPHLGQISSWGDKIMLQLEHFLIVLFCKTKVRYFGGQNIVLSLHNYKILRCSFVSLRTSVQNDITI